MTIHNTLIHADAFIYFFYINRIQEFYLHILHFTLWLRNAADRILGRVRQKNDPEKGGEHLWVRHGRLRLTTRTPH
jgi:hypothetical protein